MSDPGRMVNPSPSTGPGPARKPAAPHGDALSWEHLHQAIARIDVDEFKQHARGLTERLAQRLAAGEAEAAVVTQGTVIFADVIRSAMDRFDPSTTLSDGAVRRWDLMERLSAQHGLEALNAAFLDELDTLLARTAQRNQRTNPLAQSARRFIEDHSHEKISLSVVAGALGVAPNYLSTLFSRECGMTLTDYIHKVRIDRAEKLLHAESRPLVSIAREVGYQNYRHFYRSFLRWRGISPMEFVRRLRKVGRG